MKKIILDSYYSSDCFTVGAVFNKWSDEVSDIESVLTGYTPIESDYIPGKFYLRELPGILDILSRLNLSEFDTIILDGYVRMITSDDIPIEGMGCKLYNKLYKKYPNLTIIGVAKSLFGKTNKIAYPICRGEATNPLWVTSISNSISQLQAAEKIKNMSGPYRLPDLIKYVDKETKK